MSLDDDADDDAAAPRPPLPPDDRLWRHPSELGAHGLGASTAVVDAPRPAGRGAPWTAVIAAGLAGAVLAAGLLALSGQIERTIDRPVVERVAVTPIVSAPLIGSGSDRGVAAVVRRLEPAVVRLELSSPDGSATGSGVLFRSDGMVLTSAHLVDDATKIGVRLADGRRFDGRLVGLDPLTDVAVVDVDATDLPVAVLGSTTDLEVGAVVLSVGCRQSGRTGPSVATGVISGLSHSLAASGSDSLHGLLQTDAPAAASAAGGPLVDTAGSVIGIVTALRGDRGAAGRFGFATPIDLARRVARQIIEQGWARHGWLGIEGTDLSRDDAASLGLDGGARVRQVDRGSPADRAGINNEDVITEVDGEPVDSMPGLAMEMRDREPGDEVEVGYWRDGEHHTATVEVGERPRSASGSE